MALFRLATFLGAFLLFAVQPLVGRAVLPLFGGGAGVWLVCLLFFQIMLLAGYGYVHRILGPRGLREQRAFQTGVALLALGSLVLGVLRGGAPLLPSPAMPGAGVHPPGLAILLVLTQACAFPVLLLGSTSPLVQTWFARTHPDSDPYGLYVLSNWGNVTGLLAFPLLAEPFLSIRVAAWGFGLLFLAYVGILLHLHRRVEGTPPPEAAPAEPGEPGEAEAEARRSGSAGTWIGLSALGSIWLLAGSNQLSRDLAAVPLLWIPPLLAYLLSFILAFGGRIQRAGAAWRWAGLLGLTAYGALLSLSPLVRGLEVWLARLGRPWNGAEALNQLNQSPGMVVLRFLLPVVAVFFACCLIHGALADRRPEPRRLTAFYFHLSLGGALGGVLVSLVAPALLKDEYELPAAFTLTALIILQGIWRGAQGRRAWGRLALATAMTGLGFTAWLGAVTDPFAIKARDFFGTVQVRRPADQVLVMVVGTTVHGMEIMDRPLEPLAYYGPRSAVWKTLRGLQAERPSLRLGVLGLGIGSIAAHARAQDSVTFFEISPKVIHLADRGPDHVFSVLASCPAPVEVREGDGRLLLQQEGREGRPRYDVLVIDAFSGGHVPAHLLTREAIGIYLDRLAPGGVLLFNLTHTLPLSSQVGATLRAMDLPVARLLGPASYTVDAHGQPIPYEFANEFLAVAREAEPLNRLGLAQAAATFFRPGGPNPRWSAGDLGRYQAFLDQTGRLSPWTDDRQSLVPLLAHRILGGAALSAGGPPATPGPDGRPSPAGGR